MNRKEQSLFALLRAKSPLAVAFSGGTDSAYLLYAAKAAGAAVTAYYVRTAFQPAFEGEDAGCLCAQLDVPLREVEVDILSAPNVTENGSRRCYYCKKRLFGALWAAARDDGYAVLCDGTNASDDAGDRPGMQALAELNVLSPLRQCGITKDEVRALSRRAGLFTWDKPAYACLATRIPTGTAITGQILYKMEKAENELMAMGFRDFRVRLYGDGARIQVRQEQLPLLLEHREEIVERLKQNFSAVFLDLEGRK